MTGAQKEKDHCFNDLHSSSRLAPFFLRTPPQRLPATPRSAPLLTKVLKWLFTTGLFVYFAWTLGDKIYTYRSELYDIKDDALSVWPLYVAVIVFFFIAMLIRAHRWAISMGGQHLFWSSYRSIAIGYLVQCPLSKVGEIVRIANQKKYSSVSLGAILSTVFVDRLLDVISLAILLIMATWLSQDLVSNHFPEIAALMPKLGFMMSLGLGALLACILFQKRVHSWVGKHQKLPETLKKTILSFMDQFNEGLSHSRKMSTLIYFFFSTVAIWLLYFVSFYAGVGMFPSFELSFVDILLLFAVATLGAIIPAPGGLAYPAVLEQALLVIHPEISPALALSLSLLMYFVNFWIANLICGGSTWLFQIFFIKATEASPDGHESQA